VPEPVRTTFAADRRAGAQDRRNESAHTRTSSWLRPTLLVVSAVSLALLSALKFSVAETTILDALQGTALAPLLIGALTTWSLGYKAPALWAPPLAASLAVLLLALGNQALCNLSRMPITALWLMGTLVGLAALLVSDWAYRQLLDFQRWPEWLFTALLVAWFFSFAALMYQLETPGPIRSFFQAPLVTATMGFVLLRSLGLLLRAMKASRPRR